MENKKNNKNEKIISFALREEVIQALKEASFYSGIKMKYIVNQILKEELVKFIQWYKK